MEAAPATTFTFRARGVFDDSPGAFGWSDPVLPTPDFTAPAYPAAWIRIRRVGTSLLGYRSPDGMNWTLLATNNPSAPFVDPVYVGVTTTAANNNPGAQNIGSAAFGFIGPTPAPRP